MTQLELAHIREIAMRIAFKISASPELDQLLADAAKIEKYLTS